MRPVCNVCSGSSPSSSTSNSGTGSSSEGVGSQKTSPSTPNNNPSTPSGGASTLSQLQSGPSQPTAPTGPQQPASNPSLIPNCVVGFVLSKGKCVPISMPNKQTHTLDYVTGSAIGNKDGKVGVYDLAAACAGKTGIAFTHCSLGYRTEYVKNCLVYKFGCGDGPTTCPLGESRGQSTPTPLNVQSGHQAFVWAASP
jgi:hypothetical protein